MKFGIDLDAATRNVPGAQIAINNGLGHMVRETKKMHERIMKSDEVEKQIAAAADEQEVRFIRQNAWSQASANYRQEAIDENRIGHVAVFDRYMPLIAQARDVDGFAQLMKNRYRWMDVSIFN